MLCLKIAGWVANSVIIIVCLSYWQSPILITCEKCYCLCVLRWLIRPILAWSKLSVVDWTTEVRARQLCWWCLSSGFALCTFLLGFADSFCLIFTSISSHEALPHCSVLCNLFPQPCWNVEILEVGFTGVFVATFCRVSSRSTVFAQTCLSEYIRQIQYMYLNWTSFRKFGMIYCFFYDNEIFK